MTSPMLNVSSLSISFGGLLAVDNVDLQVETGEIVSIIGPNGAGKTTVFNCICGFYKPTTGIVSFQREDITGMPCYKTARRGMVRTFQNIRLFKGLTALENLLIAQHQHLNTGFFAGLFSLPSFRRSEREAIDKAVFWLDYMGLKDLANREAGTLPYGTQRRLEIARCMITEPRLLMLDEPAAGLNPQEKQELQTLIKDLRTSHDVSVLLIEHDMRLVMSTAERILVMEHGKTIATGTPEEIRRNERVIKAYLGEE
ncbi:MAG: high-affinity branched-chain amino acid ABC transporter ATP-binding protein LivG [Methylobacteriaceae bacterium]|jgi:branched-chain amino acid transport system ATP-binding protein|nr:high-affinity branched-chain amino acid ABC transporter ATP-binding protein LivG [Methylobacteriaceae bacterium]